ncbi:MAG TPA: hypothetical protein VL172_03615, partial [Kofleriaceae bacterium]|nr:hypothetical protein [Kofleriaceae bacterium]
DLRALRALGEVELFIDADLLAWRFADYDAPVLDSTGGADLRPLGTVFGGIVHIGIEVTP